mgnify:CR=1 FL=1
MRNDKKLPKIWLLKIIFLLIVNTDNNLIHHNATKTLFICQVEKLSIKIQRN